ncbi:MAG: hypothetical protein JW749_07440 [Sedimentisphaerales bacterium]|nr:hypothetical protein [Sedimentisphaerales bacterium]
MNRATRTKKCNGFALPLVIIVVIILAALATGLLFASYLVRVQAVKAKCETEAMLAAEAGFEKGIFWMTRQKDILGALQSGANEGTIDFDGSSCEYIVDFDDFIGAQPVFRIISTGTSGVSKRVVDVQVIQEITGWVMGKCRIPTGPTSTGQVNFASGEILDIPIHINNLNDTPDERDIYISGSPRFLQKVEMGESRRTAGNFDKYSTIMSFFEEAIYFDQPNVRITDEDSVTSKVNRFRDSTDPAFRFTPEGNAQVSNPQRAVQLEFYVQDGIGKVRITNNCTVLGYQRNTTHDYKIKPGSNPQTYQTYYVYAYHYAPSNQAPVTVNIEDTYVTQTFGTKQSDPGGQIFVDGNVIIGSELYDQMTVKGTMTVVATGNIWIGDSIVVDGPRDATTQLPKDENPNILGLIAQGVVKVVDPGFSAYSSGLSNYYPGQAPASVPDKQYPSLPAYNHSYKPIGNGSGTNRVLPRSVIVEAAVTVGGGGWGAENVAKGSSYGGRKENSTTYKQDFLILRGTISESIRGVVGIVNSDGFIKQYYLDRRLLTGILPGDLWFGGKYVPAPAGWHDYRPEE